MRLIDADSFKRFLQALCKAGAPYEEVIQLLDKEPTAFDKEKVIAQIEEEKFGRCDDSKRVLGYAQEYVRKGGWNE